MKKNVKLVVLAVVLALVSAASAVVTVSGGLSWDGTSGAYAGLPVPSNLATGALAIGSSDMNTQFGGALPQHQIANINDGIYSSMSWIPQVHAFLTPPPPIPAYEWVGVDLGTSVTVNAIAFGRDNGNPISWMDRSLATYVIQYTQDTGSLSDASAWTTIGSVTIGTANNIADAESVLRKEFTFAAVNATGVRILIPTGSGTCPVYADNICIDEMELYNIPEPATMAILGLGGLLIRRRRKA